MTHKIAVIPGDGIGPEVVAEGAQLLEQFGCELTYFDWGANRFLKDGVSLPKNACKMLENQFDAIYFGALGDKRVPDMGYARDILLGLRKNLDLFVNLRPIQLLSGRLTPLKEKTANNINFYIFRENTQDCYLSRGSRINPNTSSEETIDESFHSYFGVKRIVKEAFKYAQDSQLSKVALAHKSNAIIYGGALWQRVFKEVSKEFPNVESRELYVDLMALELVQKPEQFDVIVTSNLFGDILSDLGAGIAGGLGLAASANMHPGKIGLFEPVHGSAPDIAGKNIANPMAAFLSAAMLLDFLGECEKALRIRQAVRCAINENFTTPDLGGQKSTSQVGQFIREISHDPSRLSGSARRN